MLSKEQIYVSKVTALLNRNKYEILKQIHQTWKSYAKDLLNLVDTVVFC